MSRLRPELDRSARKAAQAPGSAGGDVKPDSVALEQTDERRRQRDERIRLLLETLPVAVLNCDRNGLIEYFNSKATELWGRVPDLRDARDRYCGSFRIFRLTGEPVPLSDGPMARALSTGVAQTNCEFILERPDGTRIFALANVVPQKDERGQVAGAVSCMLDITDRKRTEALLLAREQEFRAMVESSPDVIVRYDRELRRTFVNSAGTAIFNIPKGALPGGPAGSPISDAGLQPTPEQVETFRTSIRQVFETGELRELSLTWPARDGQRIFNVRLAPEFDSNGSIACVLGIGRDITRLKSTEDALRRVQAYLAEGQRLTHTGSWAWDPKTRENQFWSAETFRIFGLEPPTAPGGFLSPESFRDTLDRVHPDDRTTFDRPLLRALGDRKDFERDFRIRLPDGTIKYVHSYGHPVLDQSGEVVEVVGTAMDVSERRFTDALLAAEKRTFEMIAGGAPLQAVLDGLCGAIDELSPCLISTILILDPDGRRLWPLAGPHSPQGWNQLIAPLAVGPCAGSCGTAAYRRQPVVVSDIASDPLWADYRDAAEAHALRACWSTPIVSMTGQVLGTFAMYYSRPRSPQPRDFHLITRATHIAQIAIERDRTQDSLREAQTNLARVSRITTVGELTAAIAHEVNQPLAAVETNAGACVHWLGATPPNLDEARKAAVRIAQDAKRAGDIIARIRALLKKGEPARALVDLNEVIQEIVVFIRPEASKQQVTFETKLAAALPRVAGDRVQLQQVVLNLVLNAIESLGLVTGRPRVLFIGTESQEHDEIRVSVRDNGVGMTPRQRERLFEAFYTTKPNGLGMGLSISRSIVEAHGGRLWATPNPGPGISFQFTLPTGGEGAS